MQTLTLHHTVTANSDPDPTATVRAIYFFLVGTTHYVNPISGATRTVSTIAGHRHWAPTECPGNTFYPNLPQLRLYVAAAMGAS